MQLDYLKSFVLAYFVLSHVFSLAISSSLSDKYRISNILYKITVAGRICCIVARIYNIVGHTTDIYPYI